MIEQQEQEEDILYNRYRPPTFEEFIGNQAVIKSLKKKLTTSRVFLFHGPSGSGKTTLARIIKEELGVARNDFHEYDAASGGGIDLGRSIKEACNYGALSGNIKIFLLDEVQGATADFFKSMLKATEDVPKHVRFIFTTTDPEKLPGTLRSRCTQFALKPLSKEDMQAMLLDIAEKEGFKVRNAVLKSIVELAEGNGRQAIVMLDQIRGLKEVDALQLLEDNAFEETTLRELCQALLRKEGWKTIGPIANGINTEPEKIRRGVLGYMTTVLLNKGGDHVANIMQLFSEPWYATGKPGMMLTCYLASKL